MDQVRGEVEDYETGIRNCQKLEVCAVGLEIEAEVYRRRYTYTDTDVRGKNIPVVSIT